MALDLNDLVQEFTPIPPELEARIEADSRRFKDWGEYKKSPAGQAMLRLREEERLRALELRKGRAEAERKSFDAVVAQYGVDIADALESAYYDDGHPTSLAEILREGQSATDDGLYFADGRCDRRGLVEIVKMFHDIYRSYVTDDEALD